MDSMRHKRMDLQLVSLLCCLLLLLQVKEKPVNIQIGVPHIGKGKGH